MRAALGVLVLLLVAGCSGSAPGDAPPPPSPTGSTDAPRDPSFRLEPFLSGLDQPVGLAHLGGDAYLTVEQGGLVRVWRGGAAKALPYLDLRGQVSTGTEQGLLGLALDPEHPSNGRVFVHFTNMDGDTRVVRYTRSGVDPDRADPLSAQVILTADQPFANHNGGHLAFGPDGHLYVGLGDGGSGGDPHGNGQSKDTLLGKILRLDVRGDSYAIPDDNPFAQGGGKGEIWAYGLRNPWRFSFDRATGDLYIGDVGQGEREEIDYEPKGSGGGKNYGWSIWEGTRRFSALGEAEGHVPPVAEYSLTGPACAVTGGHVHRGEGVPSLKGAFLFADYCTGDISGLWGEQGGWVHRILLETDHMVSSFAEDRDGEVYVVDHNGSILRIVAA